MTDGPESAEAPRRSRRAAGSTAAAGHQERESQQRARDREALRAYKALTDSEKRPEESSANPPTRRQLRIAQQQSQQAAREKAGRGPQESLTPATSRPPQTDSAPHADSASSAPANRSGSNAGPAAAPPSAPSAPVSPAPAAGSGRRSGPAAPNRQTEPAGQEPSRRERRRRAAEEQQTPVITPVTPAPNRAPAVQAPATPAAGSTAREKTPKLAPEPQEATPSAATAQPQAAPQAAGPEASAADVNADIANMSVEQALAAREALKHQARNQVAAMEALQKADPQGVDLELLAQQRALAERAAVLNRRTQNIQRLAQENEQRRSPQSDPTTAHNLAMVTPLEFVEVPGLERPVMKRPPTSHVPVVTSSNPASRQAPGTGRIASVGQPAQAGRPGNARGKSAAKPDVRHSKILARADALVNAPLEADQGAKPIGARSAFGLDPLDVMTAGLGRSRRIRAVSLGVVGVGLAALILGIILIVGGLGS